MLTPAEAEAAIAASLAPLPVEACALEQATGRVLREAIDSDLDQPPFDRVAMDGIAIASSEFAAGRRSFRIAGVAAAGAPPPALVEPGTCIEVMTGAVLPAGADAVIPVEELEVRDGHAELSASARVATFSNVHRKGTDTRAGARVLAPGVRLRGPELAIAASAGRMSLLVSRQPRIGIVSTGDELVPPGVRPSAWQVRRSNAYAIAATLREHGYQALSDAHSGDDPAALRALLAAELASRDVLVLSGGVSAGRFDHVPATLTALGVRQVFHKVAQRPGKPLWFGTHPDGQVVFALPGNPVSTLVCLVRYVLPALVRLSGGRPAPPLLASLLHAIEAHSALTAFIPVERPEDDRERRLRPRLTHGSGDFTALAGTVGFVELAPGQSWEPGSLAPLYNW